MAKYKITGEIQSDGPPALQHGLTAELVSSLPLEFDTAYSGRRVEVKQADWGATGAYVSIYNAPNTHLSKNECRRVAEALLEAAGEPAPGIKSVYGRGDTEPPSSITKVRDRDGDIWTRGSNGLWNGSSWEHITRYAPLEVVSD